MQPSRGRANHSSPRVQLFRPGLQSTQAFLFLKHQHGARGRQILARGQHLALAAVRELGLVERTEIEDAFHGALSFGWRIRYQAAACERQRSHSPRPMRPRRAAPRGTSECLIDPAAEGSGLGVAHDLTRLADRLEVAGDDFVERQPCG